MLYPPSHQRAARFAVNSLYLLAVYFLASRQARYFERSFATTLNTVLNTLLTIKVFLIGVDQLNSVGK